MTTTLPPFTGRCCRVHGKSVVIQDTLAPLHPDGYVRTIDGVPLDEWRKKHEIQKKRDRPKVTRIILPQRRGSK